jgi:decaprenylphospho-beta-D-erythro-pentofuranosid-2-ulose 2-reductase
LSDTSIRAFPPASGVASAADPATPAVLILGATSALAQATARLFAVDGARLVLVARDSARLDAVADDLRSRGAAAVAVHAGDLADTTQHARIIADALADFDDISHVLIAHGVLPEPGRTFDEPQYGTASMNVNFMSPASLCLQLAPHFEQRRSGCIAVLGSVAGDRIRSSNAIYGTAKGALDLFLRALRTRLDPSGVRVLTLKPGPVDTPMTAGMRRGALMSPPDRVARAIYRAMTGRASGAVYIPGYWRSIMFVIRRIPEGILRRLPI